MRIFQNAGVYRSYKPRLSAITKNHATFSSSIDAFINDRVGIAHILKPVLDRASDGFFTNGDDERTQHLWAAEQGLSKQTSLDEILLAQIEHHNTDVFYNSDPMRYGDQFLKRLPGCVRKTIAWRAAPSSGGEFLRHDVIVNNFPSILNDYQRQGVRAEYLAPAHDPEMDRYAAQTDRPVDILFVGSFSRYHRSRTEMLESIAALRESLTIALHLDVSRYTRLSETPLGWVGPLKKDRRSSAIRSVSRSPVFGRDLLKALSEAKIVVNGAIDMAGPDRGNMRVWEALGCGATLISDRGLYPDHIEDGVHFCGYDSPLDVPAIAQQLISAPNMAGKIANAGYQSIANNYSKELQWRRFLEIVA